MKNLSKLLFTIVSLVIAFSSCENVLENEIQSQNEEMALTKSKIAIKDSLVLDSISVIEETEESRALKEMLENNKFKLRSSYDEYLNRDEYFSNNLWQIRELPLLIRSRASNGGNQYLTSAGKNAEVYLSSYTKFPNQFFYLKIYSPTSGLSNVIYSLYDKTPIAAGYYTNNPNRTILYVKPDDSGSLYTADWDINPVSTPGYVQLKNNGLITQSSGGAWYDSYYKVMGVGNSNKITFDKYVSGNANQEFELSPIHGFTIESLEFVNDYSATITRIEDGTVVARETNPEYSEKRYDLSLAKLGNASSSFVQKKNIKFYLSNSSEFKAKRPEIINEKLFLMPSISSPACLYYYNTNYAENTGCPKSFSVNIPARSSVTYTYKIAAYRVSSDYKLIASYKDRKVTLSGRWTGVIYDNNKTILDYVVTPLDSNGGDIPLRATVLKSVNAKNATKSNPLNL